ncbi:hypothetical protein BY458DRAFT_548027 [Sporodiniella umbellata]|nr:hypothetical protein BY458DRAFT_548027 [Sporodiniella umbellata]
MMKEEMELDLEMDEEFKAYDEAQEQQNVRELNATDAEDAKSSTYLVEDEPIDRFEPDPRNVAIYLRGVDDLSTDQVRTYANNSENLVSVEWIDDTSCNLVMNSVENAQALAGELLLEDTLESLNHRTLLKAKPLVQDEKTVDSLFIRIATEDDIKRRGARFRSQYYKVYGHKGHEISQERVEARKELKERMSRSGGDGRSVFERLGNRVSRSERRRDRRSASPVRERSASPVQHDIPERLKQRLGKKQEKKEE